MGGEGWGKKKKYFYGGNTYENEGRRNEDLNDSEMDEDEIEEEESRKLQIKQNEQMDEEDFLGAFSVSDGTKKVSLLLVFVRKLWSFLNCLSFVQIDKNSKDSEDVAVKLNVSKLSKKEQAKLFAKESPEFAGIFADFEEKMKEAQEKLQPLVQWIQEGRIPPGPAADFITKKYQIILK